MNVTNENYVSVTDILEVHQHSKCLHTYPKPSTDLNEDISLSEHRTNNAMNPCNHPSKYQGAWLCALLQLFILWDNMDKCDTSDAIGWA